MDESSLVHSFHLRPDFQVSVRLPLDLTEREAERIAMFIRSLPMGLHFFPAHPSEPSQGLNLNPVPHFTLPPAGFTPSNWTGNGPTFGHNFGGGLNLGRDFSPGAYSGR